MTKQARNPKHASTEDELHPPAAHGLDEVVVVPKGQSKLRFIITLGLTIFVLVIFTVGSELMTTFNRRSTSGAYMSFEIPGGGAHHLSYAEFIDQKRKEDDFLRPMSREHVSIPEEDLAVDLVNDELAKAAGISVSKQEVAKAILEGYPGVCPSFMSGQFYKQLMANMQVEPENFEQVLRRKLRVARYESILRAGVMTVEPSAIETQWKSANQEQAYDYIEVSHASFEAEAQAAKPDAAGMKAWYDALPDKRSLVMNEFSKPTITGELVYYRTSGEDSAEGLLARFPAKPDVDAEKQATDYYNEFASVRYRRETPLPADSPDVSSKDRLLYSFDEVADQARRESKVHAAMKEWLAELKAKKTAGETIDLAAEAQALGLSFRAADGPKTEAEWGAVAGVGGPFLGQTMFGAAGDSYMHDVVVESTALVIARVLEKTDASAPPYETVADKVDPAWLKDKETELALAKLKTVRDSLPPPAPGKQNPVADEAAFATAAAAAGLTVQRRDWMSAQAAGKVDASLILPGHDFIRMSMGPLRSVGENEVAPPMSNRAKDRSYLVRSLGKRDPAEVKLTPQEVQMYQGSLAQSAYESFRVRNLTPDAYARRYKLRLVNSKTLQAPES